MKHTFCLLAALFICSAGLPDTAQQRRPGRQQSLTVGQKAPAFKLEYLNKDKNFELKDSLGKKPVVLIFGSYT